MTVAFGTIGAKSAGGTTTISVAYPASLAAGDIAVAARCIWPSTATASNESGWNAGPDGGSGTGTAADAHTTRARGDYKVLTGSESGSVTFDQAGTPDGAVGIMLRYTKAAGTTWEVVVPSPTSIGTDTSHGTGRSTGQTSAVTVKPGDMIIAIVAVDTDATLTPTSPIITVGGSQTGVGTKNRRTSGAGVLTGNDGNIEVYDAVYSGSEQSGTLAFAFTEATSQCGPVAFMILRELTLGPTQAVETDTAQTQTIVLPVAVGQANATGTAQAVTPALGATPIAVAQASESDTGQTLTPAAGVVNKAVAQASETDTGQTITPRPTSTIAAGQASETDTGQSIAAVAAVRTIQADLGSESDAAQVMTPVATFTGAVGMASETDLSQVFTVQGVLVVPFGMATETEIGQGFTVQSFKSVSLGQATETDSGQGASPFATRTVTLGQATESDSAQGHTAITAIGSPRDISGLLCWYSAKYEKTLYSNGAGITTLHDLSGNSNDVTNVTASHPLMNYTGGPSNLAYFGTTASRYFELPHGMFTGLTVATALIVAKAGGADGLWNLGSDGSLSHFGFGGVAYDQFGTTLRKSSTATVTTGTWYRYQAMSKANSWKAWLDGVSSFTTGTNTVNFGSTHYLGASGTGGSYGLPGMGLFVLYNRELTADETTALNNWAALNLDGGLPPAGNTTVSVTQPTETDTGQSVTAVATRTVAVGQASETDAGQAVTATPGVRTAAVAQATETDSGQIITPAKGTVTAAVGQATETDTGQALTPAAVRTVAVGQALEADSAQAVILSSGGVTGAVGQASEGDTAGVISPVVGGVSITVGQTSETDTAQVVSVVFGGVSVVIGLAIETETGMVLTPQATVIEPLGQTSETDTGQAVTSANTTLAAIDQGTETDTAGALTAQAVAQVAVAMAVEADLAQDITPFAQVVAAVGKATETDTAQSMGLSAAISLVLSQAAEADTAQAISALAGPTSRTISQAFETEVGQPVTVVAVTSIPLGQASEASVANAMTIVATFKFWNGTGYDNVVLLGYWDGAALHDVEVAGYWDGSQMLAITSA